MDRMVARARARPFPWLLVLLLWGSPGCGDSKEGGAPSSTSPAEPAQGGTPARGGRRAAAPELAVTDERPLDTPQLGGLHGTILFRGKAPERFELGAAQKAECKHHPEVDQRSNLVVVDGQGHLANVFVTLSGGVDAAKLPPPSSEVVTLWQEGCMYVPRVVGVRVGQTLRVTNDDPTNHNVHTRGKRNPEFNRNMGVNQDPLEFRFERPERPIPFACDIHPWMGAAVFVEDHPWFAVSDESGAFSIEGVPPGTYEVEAIHETLGKTSGTLEVKAGVSRGVGLELSE